MNFIIQFVRNLYGDGKLTRENGTISTYIAINWAKHSPVDVNQTKEATKELGLGSRKRSSHRSNDKENKES